MARWDNHNTLFEPRPLIESAENLQEYSQHNLTWYGMRQQQASLRYTLMTLDVPIDVIESVIEAQNEIMVPSMIGMVEALVGVKASAEQGEYELAPFGLHRRGKDEIDLCCALGGIVRNTSGEYFEIESNDQDTVYSALCDVLRQHISDFDRPVKHGQYRGTIPAWRAVMYWFDDSRNIDCVIQRLKDCGLS